MEEISFIDLKKCILQDNIDTADTVRKLCKENHVFLWNIMSSPGSGKTTFISNIIKSIGKHYKIGVIEGDIESMCDAKKVQSLDVPVVQLRTGGDCHLDAAMILKALEQLPLAELDIVIIENIGNLVCPAEFDLGADFPMMLLSVPEGDDKIIKYPLMFTVTKAVVITKIDVLPYFDFNMDALKEHSKIINKDLKFFPVSAKTGEGMEFFIEHITSLVERKIR